MGQSNKIKSLGLVLKRTLFTGILGFIFFAGNPGQSQDYQILPVGPWGYLNNSDDPIAIAGQQAQDLLNVHISPAGQSVIKRKGYAEFAELEISTSPVHGVFNFYDSVGNDVSLFFNDTRMASSIGGNSPEVLFSTGPFGATYQCDDSLGFAYCADSQRGDLIKTDGDTYSQIYTTNNNGTMVAAMPERLALAGFSGSPSRIDFSAANDFSDWTIGNDGTDPAQFTINAPGYKTTHITYAFGRLIWFKESSFGYVFVGQEDNQADWEIRTISPTVGTLDNTSVYREGILYFRGQDGHIYGYDGSVFDLLTRDLEGTISVSGSQTTGAWLQTTQTDFETSSITPSGYLSTTIESGSIMLSSWTATETTTADFGDGTQSGLLVDSDKMVLDITDSDVVEPGFEDGSGALADGSGWVDGSGDWGYSTGITGTNCTLSPRTGTYAAGFAHTSGGSFNFTLIDLETGDQISVTNVLATVNSCTYTERTLSADVSYKGKKVYIQANYTTDDSFMTTQSDEYFIYSGENITFYTATDSFLSGTEKAILVDDFSGGRSTTTTGNYTSQSYNTGLSSSIVSVSSIGETINDYPILITLQTSSDDSAWTELGQNAKSTNSFTGGQQYVRYLATFSVTGSSIALSSLNNVTLTARSPYATYYSQINETDNLTSWDEFVTTGDELSDGQITFYIRAATGSFSITSSTPAWSEVSNGEVPTASTGTFVQVKAEYSLTAATQNPVLEQFVVNWSEGQATDKSYATYFDESIWWSVTSGTGVSTNNRILRLDLTYPGWTIYDIPTNGMLVRNNSLYFGSSEEGKIFKFGDVDADDGDAINAYWKSKDFFVGSPFIDKELVNISVAADSVENSSMTITYTVDGSESSYTMPLYSPSTTIKRNNRSLPNGTQGNTFSFKFGNNAADQPFETFAIQYGIRMKPWRPEN